MQAFTVDKTTLHNANTHEGRGYNLRLNLGDETGRVALKLTLATVQHTRTQHTHN